MTNEQRVLIDSLRAQGLGSKKIAAQTELSENTVKSYLRRGTSADRTPKEKTSAPGFCRFCGKPVKQNPGRKAKLYCSDACRSGWWNSHLDQVKRKAIYSYVCPTCNKPFTAYGDKNRKYCSHACYVAARFGGAK